MDVAIRCTGNNSSVDHVVASVSGFAILDHHCCLLFLDQQDCLLDPEIYDYDTPKR